MFLLDANAWITHMRSTGKSRVSRRLTLAGGASIVTCSVLRGELLVGAYKSRDPARNVAEVTAVLAPFPSKPFDNVVATVYGQIRAALEPKGMKIGGNDFLIAAVVVANGYTVVTHNTGEFSRVPNLTIEDWQ